MQDMKQKEYVTFWTYLANSSESPRRVRAWSPRHAIEQTTPYTDDLVRHLVFEVGGDLVHDGPCSQAPDILPPFSFSEHDRYDVLVGNVGTVGRFDALDAYRCALSYAEGRTRAEGSVAIMSLDGEPVLEMPVAE